MTENNLTSQVIDNVYKNAHIALQSISNVLPEAEDGALKRELHAQYEGYEKFIGELSKFMHDNGFEPKDVNPLKKAMLFTSVKMNALTDDSASHLADMMVKGTVMGITELRQLLSRSGNSLDGAVKEQVKKLLDLEESYEKRLKAYL